MDCGSLRKLPSTFNGVRIVFQRKVLDRPLPHTKCYDLNAVCVPKVHVLKAQCPAWRCRGHGTLKRWSLMQGIRSLGGGLVEVLSSEGINADFVERVNSCKSGVVIKQGLPMYLASLPWTSSFCTFSLQSWATKWPLLIDLASGTLLQHQKLTNVPQPKISPKLKYLNVRTKIVKLSNKN